MNGLTDWSDEFVEIDPTGRYGRYNEVLGKGSSKTVYRAFDEFEGIEVAWNQVKLYDFLQSPEDLERLYCEIHLLKTLKHDNIMKFYSSWVDVANRNINFVTEMFTSGTLRQFRLKHKKVNIRAVKHWCRQILKGLNYLHSHDPPVIHRDLKCDNIFINGHQGEVKIGDLGLAAILKKSHADHCVGTPEFMAPEVYQEEYNELVDIYSFGMCILEMVTFEYPYSECTHPAQIYRKVISGTKPDALYKVKDPEVRQFVDKCLASVSTRLSARELLNDPFLRNDVCGREPDFMGTLVRQPYLQCCNEDSNGFSFDVRDEWGYYRPVEAETTGIELFEQRDDDLSGEIGISITGKTSEDGGIFLKLRIADEEGRVCNIYFPFDVETDTALSVATEMVAELDIIIQDVNKIAETIDGEVALLVPEWSPRIEMEEPEGVCQNCAFNGSFTGLLSNKLGAKNLECLKKGCASLHGRFEEITYRAEQGEHRVTESAGNESSESDYRSFHSTGSSCCDISSSHENEIQQGLRWLKAKYRMELRHIRDNQLGLVSKAIDCVNKELETGCGVLSSLLQNPIGGIGSDDKRFESNEIVTAKSFYCGSLLPRCLHRTTSLPVDAVYM